MTEPLYGAIEGGGTKFVCAIGHSPSQVLNRIELPTREPSATLADVMQFFTAAQRAHGSIRGFGVACFGPLDLHKNSASYGHVLKTPKRGWSGVDLLGPLAAQFRVPIAIDTDVGAAALAELQLGAGRDVRSLAYVTVGTGIGGGFAPKLWPQPGLLHPEMGHLRIRRDPSDTTFDGVCPYHGDCLEGLASGPAIRARWHRELNGLALSHPAWSVIGGYLGQLAASITLMASPERIVFGGGVMTNGTLLAHIRGACRDLLNGYLPDLDVTDAFNSYICPPALADQAGIAGALLMAKNSSS
jgi:fructokinase